VSLTSVWMQTAPDGLVRTDQVIGIEAHQTPALTGKPARWLLDVVLPVPIGSGTRQGHAGFRAAVAVVAATRHGPDRDPELVRDRHDGLDCATESGRTAADGIEPTPSPKAYGSR
jgi:hypothetical protein